MFEISNIGGPDKPPFSLIFHEFFIGLFFRDSLVVVVLETIIPFNHFSLTATSQIFSKSE